MRKRKYLMGLTLALATSVAVAGTAHAAVLGQTLTVAPSPTKQAKKKFGAGALDVNIATTHSFPQPAAQTAQQTDVDFDKDYRFTPGKLPQCNPASLANTTTAAAQAACPGSQVGSGDATLCSSAGGCGALSIPAVVTAFNGTPSGGNPTFLLHVKAGGIAAAVPNLVLVGTLINSPAGGEFGKRLSVQVPDTSSQGVQLTNFHTVVPKTRSQKPKKKKGKKKKPARYYIEARCSDKSWQFQETTLFRAGGGTATGTATVPCKQKKAKKKKK
ncbi:MAG: hypothetical protein ACRDL6_02640 [Solirubrobacterales bacterium]